MYLSTPENCGNPAIQEGITAVKAALAGKKNTRWFNTTYKRFQPRTPGTHKRWFEYAKYLHLKEWLGAVQDVFNHLWV